MSKSKRNGSEAKFYPNTSTTLERALLAAKTANDNMGGGVILRPATEARLNAIQPQYHLARQQVGAKKAAYMSLTSRKDIARNDTAMYTSHFLQVFNMGAKRGLYLAGERVIFGMHENSEALPSLKGDSKILWVAERVVEGEAWRIAKGRVAVVNPSAAEVGAKLAQFQSLTNLTSNANDAYGDAQKALRHLHREARAVVKKVWREVENHYNEGDRPRMRKLAREWGVVYARKGGEKQVSGIITDGATGQPLPGVKVKFENGKNKSVTNAQGRFTLITNLLHEQVLVAVHSTYEQAEITIQLIEGEENKCEVKMERKAG
jgi:hypothetical protein